MSLNLKDDNYWKPISWADQAQRERIHLCSRLEMKSLFHQESNARSCRQTEELKRRCYQEENTEKQRRLEEFLAQQNKESRTVSLLRDQVRRLQERLEYIEDSKIFYNPDSPSSYNSICVPHQALITSRSRKPSREDGTEKTKAHQDPGVLLVFFLPTSHPHLCPGQSQWTSFSASKRTCVPRGTHKLASGMSERTEVFQTQHKVA